MKSIAVVLMSLCCILLVGCDKGKKPYEEAEVQFNKSDYATAKAKAQEVIQNAPNSKYLPQASAILEKVEKIESLSKVAAASIEDGDYEKGIAAYKEVLLLDPNNKKAFEAKQSGEALLAETPKSDDEKKLAKKGMSVKVIEGYVTEKRTERGEYATFPSLDIKVINKSPYHVKLLSAEIQYLYLNVRQSLYLDQIDINRILKKESESNPIQSESKLGIQYRGFATPVFATYLCINTNVGKICTAGAWSSLATFSYGEH